MWRGSVGTLVWHSQGAIVNRGVFMSPLPGGGALARLSATIRERLRTVVSSWAPYLVSERCHACLPKGAIVNRGLLKSTLPGGGALARLSATLREPLWTVVSSSLECEDASSMDACCSRLSSLSLSLARRCCPWAVAWEDVSCGMRGCELWHERMWAVAWQDVSCGMTWCEQWHERMWAVAWEDVSCGMRGCELWHERMWAMAREDVGYGTSRCGHLAASS